MEPNRGDTLKQVSDDRHEPTPALNEVPPRRLNQNAPSGSKTRSDSRSTEQFMLGALLLLVAAVAVLGIMRHNVHGAAKPHSQALNPSKKHPLKADPTSLEERARPKAYELAKKWAGLRVEVAQRGLTPSELETVAHEACGEAFLHEAGLSDRTTEGKRLKELIVQKPIANLLHSAMIGANEGNEEGVKLLTKPNGSSQIKDKDSPRAQAGHGEPGDRNAAQPGGKSSSAIHHVYSQRLLNMKDFQVSHTAHLDTHPVRVLNDISGVGSSHSPGSDGSGHATSSPGAQSDINHLLHQ